MNKKRTYSKFLQNKIEEIVLTFGAQNKDVLRELLEDLVEEAKIDSFRK